MTLAEQQQINGGPLPVKDSPSSNRLAPAVGAPSSATATSVPTSSSASASTATAAAGRRLDPLEVGWQFVQEYYTILNKDPSRLHCFYNKSSLMVHGFEAETVKNCTGQQEIHRRFKDLQLADTKVVISNVDSMGTLANGILVCVLGELESRGEPVRKFSQVFVLAEQPNGYFVLNDVFRYLKDDSVVYAAASTAVVSNAPVTTVQQVNNVVHVVEEPVEPVVVERYHGEVKEEYVEELPEPVAPVVAQEKPQQIQQSEPVERPVPAAASAQSANVKPKSWASLAKSDVKPQPVVAATTAAAPIKTKVAAANGTSAVPAAAPKADKEVKVKPGSPSNGFASVEQGEIAVFIRGFSKRTKIQDLKDTFGQLVAPVKWVELVSESSAYIEFSDTELVKKALSLKSVLINNETVLIDDRRANGNQPYRRNSRKVMNKSGNQSSSSLNSNTSGSQATNQRAPVSSTSIAASKTKKQ